MAGVPKNTISLLFFLAFIIGIFTALKLLAKDNRARVIINNQVISVGVAKTSAKLAQGLSGRNSLANNEGVLFVFSNPGYYPFLMKEMKFDLDFVFIKNDQVVAIAENIPHPQPDESPQTINAAQEFDKALEINAGGINKLRIKVGDKVQFLLD